MAPLLPEGLISKKVLMDDASQCSQGSQEWFPKVMSSFCSPKGCGSSPKRLGITSPMHDLRLSLICLLGQSLRRLQLEIQGPV
ncbi:hypothetical protein TorRG33x02_042100 [Trema orientale]|uniref:Uncharacterized protein n=1 Tax=Trema orientale TaxID=63057 RepID=A0A2P5FQK7_TREOI|nr:hypothetical protein TorRG33x02_042100 [Trema orientale]